MNTTRCVHCGKDLSATDVPGESSCRCPQCGLATAPQQDAGTPGGAPSTLKPAKHPPSSQSDTDPIADVKTIAIHQPAAFTMRRPNSAHDIPAAGTANPEHYDFLQPPLEPDEIGRLGDYRILKVLGAGGMGVVYEAEDPALQRRVALKAMLPTLAASASARQRFLREARAAAAVEHEHIVAIYQVGEDRGVPFLAMPLLKGESLENRLHHEGRLPLSEVVRIGSEIAEALAAAHEHGLIHRDIKPGNIWLEAGRGKVKLLDFGLARAVDSDTPLTQQGSIVGTPAFMAPEQATGEPIDARCDLFSLGCVLYRICTGTMAFQGSTALSTLMDVMNRQPAPPLEALPEMPAALSALIMQLLAKKPADRPASARAVIDVLAAVGPLPLTTSGPSAPVANVAEPTTEKVAGLKTQLFEAMTPAQSHGAAGSSRRRWPPILAGLVALGVLIGGAFLVAGYLNRPSDKSAPGPQPPAALPAGLVEIGIAYGSEKQGWFRDAVQAFAATPEGKNIKINLIPFGSQEGADAVNKGDERIHVWSPASSLYKGEFIRAWTAKHRDHNPILKEESLVLTPMVFVFWKERYDAFLAKYKTVSLTTIGAAMEEKGGWGAIAGHPEWGRFRFGHTDPARSNSGLMTLLLMACAANDGRPVTDADIARAEFQARLAAMKRASLGTSNSTGNLMKEMVTRGPSAYDAVIVYENLAIDFLKAARNRWGDLRVAYPPRNLWSEHPYCILDVPWSTKEQRHAAEVFLNFLMSEPMQQLALKHGFRPGNIDIPYKDTPDSPFLQYKENGLAVDAGAVCESTREAIVPDLLRAWADAK